MHFFHISGTLQFHHPPGLVSGLPVSSIKFRGLWDTELWVWSHRVDELILLWSRIWKNIAIILTLPIILMCDLSVGAHSSGIPSVCKQVVSVETTRDIEWATYTCTLGFQVFGKWRQSLAPSLSHRVSSSLLPSLFLQVCVFLCWFHRPLLSPPQACGPMGQTALTSTLSAGVTIRVSWSLATTLGRSTSLHTPVHSSGWDLRCHATVTSGPFRRRFSS